MTTGTYNLVSFILNVAPVGGLISDKGESTLGSTSCAGVSVITQFLDHLKIRFTWQLISGSSNVLQKLLTCFNGTTNSTYFVLPRVDVFPMMTALHLKY